MTSLVKMPMMGQEIMMMVMNGAWRVHGRCMEGAWRVHEGCMEGAWMKECRLWLSTTNEHKKQPSHARLLFHIPPHIPPHIPSYVPSYVPPHAPHTHIPA